MAKRKKEQKRIKIDPEEVKEYIKLSAT